MMKYSPNPLKDGYKTKHETTPVIVKRLEKTIAYTPDYIYWIEYRKARLN